ncbi:hypothetical protein ABPG72_017003 [Tetrahymena utriculariae]
MDNIVDQIKKIDLFGIPVSLVMNKKTHYNTLVGSFASIIAILFVALFFRDCLMGYVTKSNVQFQKEEIYSQTPQRLVLSEKSFMFALGIEQPKSDFTTNPLFNITVLQTTYLMNGQVRTKATTQIQMEPCSIEHFQLTGEDQYNKMNILSSGKNFICPKLNQNLEVEGIYTNERFSFIRIYVTRCNQSELHLSQNNWRPLKCGSDDYFNSYIQQIKYPKLLIYTSSFNINPQDTTNYAIPYIQDQQTVQFSPYNTFKNVDLFVKDVEINTDNNIIFQSGGQVENFITFNPTETIIVQDNYINNTDQPFIQLQLRRSLDSIKIQRSFKKLTELMYQIGGLVKCVFLLLEIFVSRYNKFQFSLELANKLYDFELSTQKHKKNQEITRNDDQQSQKDSKNTQKQIEPKNQNVNDAEPQIINLGDFRKDSKKGILQIKSASNNLVSTASGIKTYIDNEESPKIQKKKQINQNQRQLSILSNEKYQNQISQLQLNQEQVKLNDKSTLQVTVYAQRQVNSFRNQLSQYFQQIISKSQRMKACFSYFLNYISFRKLCNSEKNYLIRKAQQFTKRDLDIYVILDKLQEIEKIKKMLLNQEQLTLFNFFPKPVIRQQQKLFQNKSFRDLNMQKKVAKELNKSTKLGCSVLSSSANLSGDNLLKERQEFTSVEAYQNLFDAYLILKKSKDSSLEKINQKLFDELGSELLQIFSQQSSQIQQVNQQQLNLPLSSNKSDKQAQQNIFFQNVQQNNLNETSLIQQSCLSQNESINYNQTLEEKQLKINYLSNLIKTNDYKLPQIKLPNQKVQLFSENCKEDKIFVKEQEDLPEIASENNRNKPCIDIDFIKNLNELLKKLFSNNQMNFNNQQTTQNTSI